MNYPMVHKLILKEWHFGRSRVAIFVAAGLLALLLEAVFMQSTTLVVRVLSVILFYGVLNGLIWLPMASVTRERTEQTLAFIISLPVTIREYTAAKIISQVLVFLIPWLVLGTSALVLIVTNESVSNDYIPLTLVVLTQLFTLFCLILAVALVSESPGFTQTVGVIANVVFWFSFSFIGVAPGFGVEKDPAAAWNSTLSYMLTGQLVLIPVLLSMTFWLQSRKKDFLC